MVSPSAREVNPDAPARQGTLLQRAGSSLGQNLQRAGTNMGLQRASTLPTEDRELRHAATMPITYDLEAERPCCGGLWKVQQCVGCALGVGALAIPCIVRPIEEYPKANEMLGVTLLCGIFWVFEVIPIYITALAPLVLMPFLGITSSQIAAQAYWNMIQMLVIGTYLVDIALEEVQLPRRAALKILLLTGVVQPGLLLFSFMLMSWLLSMLCNNIAVTLIITPFAIGILNAAEEQARDNAAAAAGDGDSEDGADSSVGEQVDASSKEVQDFAVGLLLGIAYSATAGGIATLSGSIPNEVLPGIDIVGQHITYGTWLQFAFPTSLATFLIAYVVLYFLYVRGLTLKTLTRDVLEAEYEELKKEIGDFSRDELLVGLVQVAQFLLLLIRPWIGQYVTTEYGEVLIGDPTLACLPAVLLFLIPSAVRPGQALLTWPAVHDKFDFGLLLLIGGGFAISSGFLQSGLNLALGKGIARHINRWPGLLLSFVIVLMTSVGAQVFSAVGTATTMLPVLNSAALNSVHNPLALVLPATVACSFAFVLPTATPANVVVLAKSQDLSRPLRVRDFFRAGLPLNAAVVVIGAALTHVMADRVYDAGSPFPHWACDGASCIWLPVPGIVAGGLAVGAQACLLTDTTADSMCKLWNETLVNYTRYLAELPL